MSQFAVRTAAVERFRPDSKQLYDIEMTARLAGVPRRSVLVYCHWHVVHPRTDPDVEGWYFDTDAIAAIRRAEYLRLRQGVNPPGIRIILDLLDQLQRR